MKADGESVAAAHSLSDDWQVVGTDVGIAPQWMAGDEDGGSAGASGSGGGVMLTIRGSEVPKVGSMAAAAAATGEEEQEQEEGEGRRHCMSLQRCTTTEWRKSKTLSNTPRNPPVPVLVPVLSQSL
ncbi:hypothetical protein B9Z19DRAFT_1096603, partial [Tuber borchii]